MTVLTQIARTIADHEPDAHGDVEVRRSNDGEDISVVQGDDMLMMSLAHARAVAAALIALADEMEQPA